MLSYKNKYILYLVLLNGLLITLLVGWGNTIFNDVRPVLGLGIAMAIFCLYELFVIQFTDSKSKTVTSRQSVNLFLGFKTGKIVLSLIFIAVYVFTIKVEPKRFVSAFLVLYFIYLVFDTLYLTGREKINKKKRDYKLEEIEKVSNYYKDGEAKEYHLKEIEKLSNYYKDKA